MEKLTPHRFFGTYLYKADIWNVFKQTIGSDANNSGIVKHLLFGVALSWVSWGTTGYLTAIYNEDETVRQNFAIGNVGLWLAWMGLDNYIRFQGLYSPIASAANAVLTAGMTVAWIVVAAK